MDNDQYGHMNNVVHYSLFDTAITLWQMDAGCFDCSGESAKLMVVESGCRYLAEAGFPDIIHAGIAVSHIGRSSWRYEIGLFRNEENSTFAEGFFAQVHVDGTTGRPSPIPEETRAALQSIRRASS